MSKTNGSTRESRAIALIEAGAVAIVPGLPYAIVKGSGKASYKVSRDGCECIDFVKRGLTCKHMLAARAICDGIKILRAEARQSGRVRLPANIARALANGAALVAARQAKAAEFDDILFVPNDLGNIGASDPADDRANDYPVPDEHDLLGSQDLDSDPYEGDRDKAEPSRCRDCGVELVNGRCPGREWVERSRAVAA